MAAADLLSVIRETVGGEPFARGAEARITTAPGAYVLLLELAQPLWFARPALGGAWLGGWLAYVGSARGGGGLKARIGRHLRPGKAVRWHVDELTNAARRIGGVAIPGGCECALVDALAGSGRFVPAMAGFGSSDCRHCTAHLLKFAE